MARELTAAEFRSAIRKPAPRRKLLPWEKQAFTGYDDHLRALRRLWSERKRAEARHA